jgi:hypothetical protein
LPKNKNMPYSQYSTLRAVKKQLGITVVNQPLFAETTPIEPSPWLVETLKRTLKQRVGYFSEKSRSEAIVFPVLVEIKSRNDDQFTLYSGAILEADKEKGLNGECDFILGLSKQNIELEAPIFCIVEAKDNDLELGLPQCIAQMTGAKIYNEQDGTILPYIFGGVTTGESWLFLKLIDNVAYVDTRQYYIEKLDDLLGVLELITRQYTK